MDASTLRLDGRVIVVTGGSAGIGRAAAVALAEAGATVAIADVDSHGGKAAVRDIVAAGGQASFLAADVRRADDWASLMATLVSHYGGIDGLFNNAGVLEGTFTATADIEEPTWDRVIDVNLKGVWLGMKHAVPHLLARGRGVVVNHASVAGLYGNRLVGAAYIASKHGVVGLTRVAALEYADRGIRINAICPGIIDHTSMSDALIGDDPEQAARVHALYPMGRVGTLREVAQTVAWMFSDAGSFITGHALPVDGGLLAQ
jgi:NAD(P)-dependent dehydrogenase (short-subunit alcohol dehydrogenase family)